MGSTLAGGTTFPPNIREIEMFHPPLPRFLVGISRGKRTIIGPRRQRRLIWIVQETASVTRSQEEWP
ncbi:MAG: hypothetical protein D6812_17775 [Deltaproteobacteria bacterium]|nr:MAG: hypothetical protein D6812_17775 [Deltaproteobacteria bacterium]